MSAAEPLNPIYTAACQFGMRGLRLMPVEHHTRKAILPEWQANATNSVEFIDQWWKAGHNGIGLCCGPQPAGWNILMVDVDIQNGGDQTLLALEAEYGLIDRSTLCWHRTPSGGIHMFFNVPAGMAVTGTDVLGPGIDTRGGHADHVGCGYGVLPPSEAPSKNPETMGELRPYGAGPGQGLLDRDPSPAPQWLLDRIVAYLNPPKVQASIDRHPSQQDRDNPWDWVRDHESWPRELEARGWQQKGKMWSRPGKTPREGTGAYLHDDGRFTFWTQTGLPTGMVELGHLNVDGSYSISLADFITAYDYDGDRTRFGREYRQAKMPPPPSAGRVQAAEGEDEASADALEDGSWFTFVDLTGFLDGTIVLAPPSVLLRTDGVGLFYPGTINGIHGESGLGKGWVAVTAVAEVVRAGGRAVYIDLEDTPTSISTRLQVIGLTVDEIRARVGYLRPTDPTNPATIARLIANIAAFGADLVIIDSLGEAFGLDSINEDKDNEVAPWLRQIPRALADTGACVIIVDHVTKTVDNPLYPKGSARKRAAVGGASYLVEAINPLTKNKGGRLRLTCAKDRYGFHVRGQMAADLVFAPSGDDLIATVYAPPAANPEGPSEQDRRDEQVAQCAVEMVKIARRKRAAFTKTSLVDGTGGYRAEIKRAAFDLLVERGHVVEVGKGKFQVADRPASPL